MASAKARWLTGVPEAKKADLIPPGWFEAGADATIASDTVGSPAMQLFQAVQQFLDEKLTPAH